MVTRDMKASCDFYGKLGLIVTYGGPNSTFTTFSARAPVRPGNNILHVNLFLNASFPDSEANEWNGWGRCIFFVDDVDALQESLVAQGIDAPSPKDAPWGERFFHIVDPSGHQLSFATPDYSHPRWHKP
mmetsp:Transcript_33970/g.52942  ORF Transcript_33970/g.52942 Transcript_33970/m.52942 type:complete len:129 (-) Transcript_33970:693-1079(-)